MHVPVEIQVWRVAVLALLGIGTDLLFHVYRAYRSVFHHRRLGHHLLDALVALATLGAVGAVVFIVNWGEVRLYVPISLAGGFLAGNLLAGDFAYRTARRAFLRTKQSMLWAKSHLVEPPKRAAKQAFSWSKEALKGWASRLEPPDDAPPEDTPPEDTPPLGTPPPE
jgi:hypothetical protein